MTYCRMFKTMVSRPCHSTIASKLDQQHLSASTLWVDSMMLEFLFAGFCLGLMLTTHQHVRLQSRSLVSTTSSKDTTCFFYVIFALQGDIRAWVSNLQGITTLFQLSCRQRNYTSEHHHALRRPGMQWAKS